jgi:hypothetical protein
MKRARAGPQQPTSRHVVAHARPSPISTPHALPRCSTAAHLLRSHALLAAGPSLLHISCTGPPLAGAPLQALGLVAPSSLRISVTEPPERDTLPSPLCEKINQARIPRPPSWLPIALLSTPTAKLALTSPELKPQLSSSPSFSELYLPQLPIHFPPHLTPQLSRVVYGHR